MGPIPWWKPAPGVGDDCSELVHEEDLSLFLLQGMLGCQQPWQEGEARTGQGGGLEPDTEFDHLWRT